MVSSTAQSFFGVLGVAAASGRITIASQVQHVIVRPWPKGRLENHLLLWFKLNIGNGITICIATT